jgi:hypothetical protein
MSAWIVVPCLLNLRAEFNAVSPNRDKGADGTVGDTNHTSTSDHTPDEDSAALRGKDADRTNEVHALDIDSTGPWPEAGWFDRTIHEIIAEQKRRWLDPADMCPLNYIIWNHRIYDKDADWAGVAYDGVDPHTNHAHFSARYETRAENDNRPWGVYERNGMSENAPTLTEIVNGVWSKLITDYASTTTPQRQLTAATWEGYSDGRHITTRTVLGAKIDQVLAAVTGQDVDEEAIAAGVLAGLTPERLGAAIVAAGFTPEAVAAMIPAGMAQEVADALHARLES